MDAKRGLAPLVGNFFRHGSNGAIALVAAALLGALAHAGRLVPQLGWVALGVAMFPFFEYVFHRYLLHAPPAPVGWMRWIQAQTHYDHHENTTRLDRLFMPIWAFVPLVVALFGLYWLSGMGLAAASALMAGNLLGLFYYEWVHYVAHVPYAPRTRYGQAMKKYHLWHHHKNEHYWFGVTSPLVDMIMRTHGKVEDIPQSPSARRLHGPHAG
jgi:hypothetical protein